MVDTALLVGSTQKMKSRMLANDCRQPSRSLSQINKRTSSLLAVLHAVVDSSVFPLLGALGCVALPAFFPADLLWLGHCC